jgi:hypothetical protein
MKLSRTIRRHAALGDLLPRAVDSEHFGGGELWLTLRNGRALQLRAFPHSATQPVPFADLSKLQDIETRHDGGVPGIDLLHLRFTDGESVWLRDVHWMERDCLKEAVAYASAHADAGPSFGVDEPSTEEKALLIQSDMNAGFLRAGIGMAIGALVTVACWAIGRTDVGNVTAAGTLAVSVLSVPGLYAWARLRLSALLRKEAAVARLDAVVGDRVEDLDPRHGGAHRLRQGTNDGGGHG